MYVADTGEGIQSELLQSVAGERSRRECERKQKIIEERRKEREGKERDLLLWEQEELFTGSDREKMENMWEVSKWSFFTDATVNCWTSHAEVLDVSPLKLGLLRVRLLVELINWNAL